MINCCVPRCLSSLRKADSSVSFHAFPSNPDVATKWIRNINLFIPNGGTWFPQTGNVVCSKHFSQSDFKPHMKTPCLKPRSVPSVFQSSVSSKPSAVSSKSVKRKKTASKSPLIVKVIKPAQEDSDDTEMDDAPLSQLFNGILSSKRSTSKDTSCDHSQKVDFAKITQPITEKIQNRKDVLLTDRNTDLTAHSSSSQSQNEAVKLHSDALTELVNNSQPVIPALENEGPGKTVKSTIKPKKKDSTTDLIEIGPSTFLKINPDVIKVTKRITPSGNTVLQFVMNPCLGLDASNLFQPVITAQSSATPMGADTEKSIDNNELAEIDNEIPIGDSSVSTGDSSLQTNNLCVAPVYLSTNLPVTQSSNSSQQRFNTTIRQKNRQIQVLKVKIDNLLKKIDELENKCIVQERQLDFQSLKKLRAIKKNAVKGEAHANFIFEQVRGYFNNVPLRWSDSTMTQCSIWCRKAPYAYEYFKKADLFRLPCLGTVKRYIKKHPEITMQIKNKTLGVHTLDSDDSSSDFDFDEEDDGDMPINEDTVVENVHIPCETVLRVSSGLTNEGNRSVNMVIPTSKVKTSDSHTATQSSPICTSDIQSGEDSQTIGKLSESDGLPDVEQIEILDSSKLEDKVILDDTTSISAIECIDVMNHDIPQPDTCVTDKSIYLSSNHENPLSSMNLNGEEIILQSGNIIHLNSELGSIDAAENQYFVIPAADDQATCAGHQYNDTQPVSFVIQNGVNSEQVIYIAENSSETTNVSLGLSN